MLYYGFRSLNRKLESTIPTTYENTEGENRILKMSEEADSICIYKAKKLKYKAFHFM